MYQHINLNKPVLVCNKLLKIISLACVLFLYVPVLAQKPSVAGCTYAYVGIQDFKIFFISDSVCVISQLCRITGESQVDTAAYVIDGWRIVLKTPNAPSTEQWENKYSEEAIYLPCRLINFVLRDGNPIRTYPLGEEFNTNKKRLEFQLTQMPGRFYVPCDNAKISMQNSQCLYLETGTKTNWQLHLLSGTPVNTDSMLSEMVDYGRKNYPDVPEKHWKSVKRYYGRKRPQWGEEWFGREMKMVITSEGSNNLVNHRFEYNNGDINEIFDFENDSVCVYIQHREKSELEYKIKCRYQVTKEGYVILTKEEAVPEYDWDETNFQLSPDSSDSRSYEDIYHISVLNNITTDTLVMRDKYLLYAKIYKIDSTNYKDLKLSSWRYGKCRSVLYTKAYVVDGEKASHRSIGRDFQKIFIPINYPNIYKIDNE